MEPRRLEIDGAVFLVRFGGFHQPLGVRLDGGEEVELPPWSCGAHLDALGRHLRPGEAGLALDVPAFCAEVLARSGLTGSRAEALAPLALWWASGGACPAPRPEPDGGVVLGGRRIVLRPWTQGERLRALAASVRAQPDGGTALDAAAYLRAMLDASVRSMEPADVRLEELDAGTAAGLLEAVVALNVPEDDGLVSGAQPSWVEQRMAAATLRLCRVLGWMPSQVWAMPAREVDRLLHLLDLAEGTEPRPSSPTPARASRPSLADHPDAIVIRIEGEEA